MISLILFILILSFLVIIHELGHFLAARLMKIRVEEFGVGYPPRAIKLFEKWGTAFTLNWIPFGGFVKMEGEEGLIEEAGEKARTASKSDATSGPFFEKSARARLFVIVAGAAVNFLFGVLAFSTVFYFVGIPSGAIIAEVMPGSPAATVSLPPQVAVVGITTADGYKTTSSSVEVIQVVGENLGQSVTIHTVGPCQESQCQKQTQSFTTTLRTAEQIPPNQGALGIKFESDYLQRYPWYEMPFRGGWYGIKQSVLLGVNILQALGKMLSDMATRAVVPTEVKGPIGAAHDAVESGILTQGPLYILLYAGMFSINLAIMNILPIPALDGGRALFILLEKVLGKKTIQKVESYTNYGGMALLLGLIILISIKDVLGIVMK